MKGGATRCEDKILIKDYLALSLALAEVHTRGELCFPGGPVPDVCRCEMSRTLSGRPSPTHISFLEVNPCSRRRWCRERRGSAPVVMNDCMFSGIKLDQRNPAAYVAKSSRRDQGPGLLLRPPPDPDVAPDHQSLT